MLNLPHLPPILFAKEVLSVVDKKAEVVIEFETIPTLAMMIEAAAQASSAFCQKDAQGYILSVSDTTLYKETKEKRLSAQIEVLNDIGELNEIYFEIKEERDLISSGKILLMTKV